MGTPSTTIAADGSLLRACEMPRMTMKLVPEFCVAMNVTLGTALRKSAGDSMPLLAIVSAVKAVTCEGTLWMSSERWRAVTTTVSMPPLSAAKAGDKPTNSPASAVPQINELASLLEVRTFMCPPLFATNAPCSVRVTGGPTALGGRVEIPSNRAARRADASLGNARYFVPRSQFRYSNWQRISGG